MHPLNTAYLQTGTLTVSDLAAALQAPLTGAGDLTVRQLVHPQENTAPDELIVLLDPAALALPLPAACVVVPQDLPLPEGRFQAVIRVARPRLALAVLLTIFERPPHVETGIHPLACVEAGAVIDPTACIGPFAYVGPNAQVGAGTRVLPHVTIGAEARVGSNCLLHPGTRVGERVQVGNRVIVHHNASIGADGFSFVTPEAGSIESARASGGEVQAQNTHILRIPSIGTVVIEDDVEIGACTTIDRANIGATIIRRGTKLDNLVMIGHNNSVGENCLIAGQSGIAGSCKVGNRVVMAGQVGLKDHISVGDDSILMAQAGVTKDVPPKSVLLGSPASPYREASQQFAGLSRLHHLRKEVQTLKARLAELEAATQAAVLV
jgi:UDP-3-O-[3-hydroxymyristoyl] glucosamine N-acyltransferase